LTKQFTFKKLKRVKTPTVIQMEATECGAAALAIVMGYYGRHVPLEKLRVDCGVSRDGSKAVNMLEAARRHGLKAQGVQMEPEDLSELSFPIIAFWEFNHFVVVEGMSKNKIYLNDPATGPRTIAHEEFDHAFTGVSLIFKPDPERFKKGGQKISTLAGLWPRIKKIRGILLFITLLSLSLIIPGILLPGFTKIFIDNILIQKMNGWLLPLLWGLLLTGLVRAILTYFQRYYLLRLQLKLTLVNSANFLWHVLRLPISFFSQRYTGDIHERVTSNEALAQWLSDDTSSSAINVISMVFYALIMFFYDWALALIAIFIAIVNASVFGYISRHIANSSYRLQQEFGKLRGIELSYLNSIETVKATSSESGFFQRWAGYHAKTINSQQKLALYSQVLTILPMLLTSLLTVAILGMGGLRIMDGLLTIGGLVAFQTLVASFNSPLMALMGLGNRIQQLRGNLVRLDDVNNHPEDKRLMQQKTEDSTMPTEKLTGKLALKNMSFSYAPLAKPALKEININVAPGEQIAIVGSSGSGKSTLTKVIASLYQPLSGEVFWDDTPAKNISPLRASQSISMVDQDIFLFEGSIYENITFWHDDLPAENISNAIADAVLAPIIHSRPQGIESKVEHGGANFSGGQKQQLEMARALSTNPTVLILDEATSALDANTEKQIMNNIKQRNITLIIVAHRLSTIRDSDKIIVLDKGEIVESGTHDTLFAKQGHYHRLLKFNQEISYE
jgi:NHLM bacteriocin system ABC transporter peptidase/ATP-binding protein